jgi:hypothetical protein
MPHGWRAVFALLFATLFAVPALAQDNFDAGKSPAQLFANDCTFCHKSPRGLAKSGGGLFGLESFLREHYTASRESAAVLARYLREQAAEEPPAAAQRRRGRSPAKPDKLKAGDQKPAQGKEQGQAEPAEKSGEAKPLDTKPAEQKPAEAKTEAKPDTKSETKPSDDKPADSKPADRNSEKAE